MPEIHIQKRVPQKTPSVTLLKRWAMAALNKKHSVGELTIRLVSKKEITLLNETYRQKKGPTNVLSFPLDKPLLGDIIICPAVVRHEASVQNKTLKAHFAHMVVHGVLHLLGYDHVREEDANKMEKKEIRILKSLGFNNPYEG